MPAAHSSAPPESLLPLESTSFIGRQRELAALRAKFQGGERLITVTGAPGMGKTRLALQYAELEEQALFVDLSSAESLADVCSAIGTRLGVLFGTDDEPTGPIGRALAARGAGLCVLDNFEQVTTLAAGAVKGWLEVAPELRLLVTSRERLKLEQEQVFELGPLTLPELPATTESIASCEAIELLIARAPRLRLTPSNSAELVELVQALEGIPLVIELAAARLGVLDPAQLVARLEQRVQLLSRPSPYGETQRKSGATLRGALDWSWEALSPDEQHALAAASVFRGGFSLEAFEAVAMPAGAGVSGAQSSALDTLQSLCEKSLIRAVTYDDRSLSTRFRLFESIRAYAAEHLLDGGASLRRHAQYFAEACGARLRELDGNVAQPADSTQHPPDWVALEWLAAELDNLLMAGESLLTSTSSADITDRLNLALGAGAVLARRGPPARYLALIDAAIAHASYTRAKPELVARAELERARMLQRLGRMSEARDALNTALERIEPLGNASLTADLLSELGLCLQASAELAGAERCYGQALASLPVTARGARARALAGLGLLRHSQGRLDEAFTHYDQALVLSSNAGSRSLEASLCKDLGGLRLQQRRFDEAREYYRRALSLHRTQSAETLSDGTLVGIIEGNLGILEQELGQYEAAESHFQRALRAVRRAGSALLEGHLLGYYGALLHEQALLAEHTAGGNAGAEAVDALNNELDGAARAYTDSLLFLRGIGDLRQSGVFSAALGALEATRGRLQAAKEAFDTAAEVLLPIGDEGLLIALELHRGHWELALAAAARGQVAEAERLRGQAEQRLARVTDSAALSRSDDARLALRLLRSALSRRALVYSEATSLLSLPSGGIDLSARLPLKRIVVALIEQRKTAPGESLTPEALIQAGWPGERMTADAALNRLKVALSTLRKLGLRELLQRTESGYLFDPAVPARIEA